MSASNIKNKYISPYNGASSLSFSNEKYICVFNTVSYYLLAGWYGVLYCFR